MAVSDWSTVPGNNSAINEINIAEGCSPAGINNAIREVMAQARVKFDSVDGASFSVSADYTVSGDWTVSGAWAFSTPPTMPSLPISAAAPSLSIEDTSRNVTLTVDTADGQSADPEAVIGLSGAGVDTFSRIRLNIDGVDVGVFSSIGGEGIFQVQNILVADELNAASLGNGLRDAVDARVAEQALGVGQTWQDVSGSRSLGTDYQNTDGRPIMVTIWGVADATATIQVSADQVTWHDMGMFQDNNAGPDYGGADLIVPASHWYRLTGSLSGGSILGWMELR